MTHSHTDSVQCDRILILVRQSELQRGMSTGLENLGKSLQKLGWKVAVLSSSHSDIQDCCVGGISYYFNKENVNWRGLYKSHLRVYKYDVIIGRLPRLRVIDSLNITSAELIANEGSIRTRLSAATFLREFYSLVKKLITRQDACLNLLWEKYPIRKNYVTVAISQYVKNSLIKYYDYNPSAIKVIHRGIEIPKTEIPNITHTSKCLRIGYLGNIQKSKGVEFIFNVIKDIEGDIEFHLAGRDFGLIDKMQGMLEFYPNLKIVYHGVLSGSEKFEFLKRLNVYVSASETEGLGKSIIEAMMVGTIVLCSDIPAHRELIISERTGLIFCMNDRIDFKLKLTKIRNDNQMSTRIAQCGRRYAIAHFREEIEALKWHRLLTSILENI